MGVALDAAGNVYLTNARLDRRLCGLRAFGNNDRHRCSIAGGKTALDHPWGIAVGPRRRCFRGERRQPIVPARQRYRLRPDGHGERESHAPDCGLKTGLTRPSGILLDSSSDLYVANASNAYGPGTIDVYAPGASGDALPIRSISGDNTQLGSSITGLAFDMSGNLYVANDDSGNQSVTIYAAGASGNVAPIQNDPCAVRPASMMVASVIDQYPGNGDVFVGCSLYDGIVDEFAAGIYGDSYPTQEDRRVFMRWVRA